MAKTNQTKQEPQEVQLTKTEAFFNKNKKTIGYAVLGVLVVVVAVFCYINFIAAPRENNASTALAACQQHFNMAQGEQAKAEYEIALNGDKGKTIGFLKVIDEYSGTDAANLAKLYAGLSYAGLEKWNEAIKYLEDFSTKDDAMISPAAKAALGDAYANTKQLDKAIDAFKDAASMADKAVDAGHNDAIAPIYLLKAGKILESQNKADEALAIYKDIKAKYLSSPVSSEIDKYIERCTK